MSKLLLRHLGTSVKSHPLLWPIGIGASLFLAICINLSMVWIAIHHPSAPSTHRHWQESLEFDQEFSRRQESQALGWHAQIIPCILSTTTGSSTCNITVEMHDRRGEQLHGLHGSIALFRGDSEAYDRDALLMDQGHGRYTAQVELAKGGIYTAQLHLEGPQGRWQEQGRVHFISASSP